MGHDLADGPTPSRGIDDTGVPRSLVMQLRKISIERDDDAPPDEARGEHVSVDHTDLPRIAGGFDVDLVAPERIGDGVWDVLVESEADPSSFQGQPADSLSLSANRPGPYRRLISSSNARPAANSRSSSSRLSQ